MCVQLLGTRYIIYWHTDYTGALRNIMSQEIMIDH